MTKSTVPKGLPDKGLIWVAASLSVNFGASYLFGFFSAIGISALLLVDAYSVFTIFFQALTPVTAAVLLHIVIFRVASNERFGHLSMIGLLRRVLFDKEFISFFLAVLFLIVASLHSPKAAIGNLHYLLLLLAGPLVFYFWWLPTRTPFEVNWSRLKKIFNGRRGLSFRLLLKQLRNYFVNHSIVVVFAFGAWAGYSRAEYVVSNKVVVEDFEHQGMEGAAIAFFRSSGPVFILPDGTLVIAPDVKFSLQNSGRLHENFDSTSNQ